MTLALMTATPGAQPVPSPGERFFAVHVAVNVGLVGVELQRDRLYAFADGNIGVPFISRFAQIAFALGVGYSHPISEPGASRWYGELFGLINPGASTGTGYVGLGVGVGLRYLHSSGFTVGLKLPVFGVALLDPRVGRTFATQVELFYGANLIALPMVSFGWRF